MARSFWPRRGTTKQQAGFREGFKSGLEDLNAAHIQRITGAPAAYETIRIPYVIPASLHRYTPDFVLPNGIIAETKGRWVMADRAKMLLVQAQYPGLDIRMVFSRGKSPISPGAKTTCGEWAEKHGFKWAEKLVPESWFREAGPKERPEVVLSRPPLGQDIPTTTKRR